MGLWALFPAQWLAPLWAMLPSPAELLVFATAVLVLNATPGVDFLLTLSRTLQGGARAGIAAALGINAGCVVHALAAAFGLATLLVVMPTAFKLVQWAGAAYLVWLGLGLLRQAWPSRRGVAGDGAKGMAADAVGDAALGDVAVDAAAVGRAVSDRPAGLFAKDLAQASNTTPRSFAADFRTGLLTNVLNPKVALFFLAFLPQFVPAASPHKTLSFLLLSAWLTVQSMLFLLGLVWLASRMQRMARLAPLGRVSWLTTILKAAGGLLFMALALRLLKEKPSSL